MRISSTVGEAAGAGEAGQLDGSTAPPAVVYRDGTVRWVRPAVISVSARHEFRANSWVATLRIGSWTYDDARVRLRARRPATGSNQGPVPVIDFDLTNFSAGDHWTLLEHSGRRVETRAQLTPLSSTATVDSKDSTGNHRGLPTSKNGDCCPPTSSDVFVTFNYGMKLRKKIGPSLLVGG